jgi:hypothetical protein
VGLAFFQNLSRQKWESGVSGNLEDSEFQSMKKNNFNSKNKFIQDEKNLEKKHYRIIIGLMVTYVVYTIFIEPKTIGHDERYLIYIFLLPTIGGAILLGTYRRQFLINRFSTYKGFILRSFMILFYLAQGVLFSYLSFGQIAKISWDYCNYTVTKNNNQETFYCDIRRFRTGKRSRIDFKFNGRHESFRVSYSDIKAFKDENFTNYELKINATKGIWNYYTVNEWIIVQK